MICERSGTSAQTDLGNLEPLQAQRFVVQDFQYGNLGKMTLDRLPRKVKAHLQTGDGQQRLRITGATSSKEGDEDGESSDEFTMTHHVTTQDVTERFPEHMREVMAELQQGKTDDSHVISKKRGPISRATSISDAVLQHVRLRPGR